MRGHGRAVLQEVSPRPCRCRRAGNMVGAYPPCEELEPERRLILFPLARQVSGYVQRSATRISRDREGPLHGRRVVEKVADVGMDRVQQLSARIRASIARR